MGDAQNPDPAVTVVWALLNPWAGETSSFRSPLPAERCRELLDEAADRPHGSVRRAPTSGDLTFCRRRTPAVWLLTLRGPHPRARVDLDPLDEGTLVTVHVENGLMDSLILTVALLLATLLAVQAVIDAARAGSTDPVARLLVATALGGGALAWSFAARLAREADGALLREFVRHHVGGLAAPVGHTRRARRRPRRGRSSR